MNQRIAATPYSRRRFIHEARAMAAVHHDNVATIFEVGESNGHALHGDGDAQGIDAGGIQ